MPYNYIHPVLYSCLLYTSLQELQSMGVANIVTFDAHDPRVQNAIPLMGFDNVIPSYQVLKALFRSVDNLVINKDEFMVVSPDEGALNRNMYYAVSYKHLDVYKRQYIFCNIFRCDALQVHQMIFQEILLFRPDLHHTFRHSIQEFPRVFRHVLHLSLIHI